MNTAPANTTPMGSEHDSDGRLVGLDFDSLPPPDVQEINPWLIAVDSSENSLRAVTFAAGQARNMNSCTLHLIHVQHWLSKEAADAELAQRALEATAQARALLDAAGLPWHLHVAMGDPAEHILERANRLRVACIVIGSRGLNLVDSLLLGSVAYKVMHLSRVPVTVAP